MDLLSRHLAASTFVVIAVLELLEAVAGFIQARMLSRLSHSSGSIESRTQWSPGDALTPDGDACRRIGDRDRRRAFSPQTRQFARSGKKERRVSGDRRVALPVM